MSRLLLDVSIVAVSLGLASGCSSHAQGPSPDGGIGGRGGVGSGGAGSAAGAGSGGRAGGGGRGGTGGAGVDAATGHADASPDANEASTAPVITQVRFLQAFIGGEGLGDAGATATYDVWTRAPNQSWVSVYPALPYGAVTGYVPVSITGGNARLWFVSPGSDPATAPTSASSDVSSIHVASGDTGSETVLVYNFFGGWAVNTISDGNPAAIPPAGQASIIFDTAPILEQFAGHGFDCGRTGLCLNSLYAEGRFSAIDPGTWTFSLYDTNSTSC